MTEHETMTRTRENKIEQIKAQAANYLRRALEKDPADRRGDYRAFADLAVELRGYFTHDGMPDYAGKSYDLRAAMREIYGMAGLSATEGNAVKAILRYHVGNAIRETLDVETLEEYGLLPNDPRERQRMRRAEGAAEVSASDALVAMQTDLQRLTESDDTLSSSDARRAARVLAEFTQWLDDHEA